MKTATLKIFSMNDCDWMAAETLEEAKAAYIEQCWAGTGEPEEHAFDQPDEISEKQYDGLMFSDDDGSTRTFRQQLQLMIERGSEKFPCFFASTEC